MSEGHNAGIKRNRRATGSKTVFRKANLSEAAALAIDEARQASGKLSTGLYLELLVAELNAQHGSLPVFSPELETPEVNNTAAA